MTNADICNMALSHIAKGRIMSLDDRTEEARQCKLHYDHLRRRLLRDYSWGFAKRVAVLALLDTKVPGWRFVYAYPKKCLAVRFVFNEAGAGAKEAEREGYDVCLVQDNVLAICCDVEDAFAEYTYDAVDAELFPPDFAEALSHLLASKVAMALTGNASLLQAQYQLYQAAIARSSATSARERERGPKYPDSYIRSRE